VALPYATTPPVRQGHPIPLKKARAQFRTQEFARVINQHGYYLVWSKAIVCPCMTPESDQAKLSCVTCDGSGFYYTDPIECRGIMTSLERNPKFFEKFGQWVEGTSSITVESMYRLGYRDRLEMIDSVMSHNEVFKKGERRGLRSRLPANTDSLRYRVYRMTKLVWHDPETPESAQPLTLEEGQHYEITEDGWIRWLWAARHIEDGDTVSALYEYHPVWVVVTHPHAVRDVVIEKKQPNVTVVALPVQAVVKLDYLADINSPIPSMGISAGLGAAVEDK